MHIKYPKIRRLWTEETEWILHWECIIQEKIDWANASVWLEEDWLHIWSRTQTLYHHWETYNPFNWLVDYILNHEWINKYLKENPTHRLYWEWLVQHTVRYSPEHYNNFRLYDILIWWDEEQPGFINPMDVVNIAEKYNIKHPTIYWTFKDPTIELLQSYMDKPNLWDKQEWIVIKNVWFINKFGRPQYAKIVNEWFREENRIIFGNANKYCTLEEQWAIKFCTPGRFMKILHKIEQDKQCSFSEKNIWEILWRCQYDVISEEIPWVVKNETVNYWILRKHIANIARTMALQYIEQWSEAHIFIFNKQTWKN